LEDLDGMVLTAAATGSGCLGGEPQAERCKEPIAKGSQGPGWLRSWDGNRKPPGFAAVGSRANGGIELRMRRPLGCLDHLLSILEVGGIDVDLGGDDETRRGPASGLDLAQGSGRSAGPPPLAFQDHESAACSDERQGNADRSADPRVTPVKAARRLKPHRRGRAKGSVNPP
jgi:hypothetical protein